MVGFGLRRKLGTAGTERDSHLLLLLVNPLHGHLLHVVHHHVGGLVLQSVVQVPLFNHLGKILTAYLQGQRNRFQDRREILLLKTGQIQLKESVLLLAREEKKKKIDKNAKLKKI